MCTLSIKGYTKIKQTSKTEQTTHLCVCTTQATAFIFPLLWIQTRTVFFWCRIKWIRKRTEIIAVFGDIVFLFRGHFFTRIDKILQFSVGKFDLFAFCLHLAPTIIKRALTRTHMHEMFELDCYNNTTENSVTYWTCRLLMEKNQANKPTKLINTETLSRATETQIRMWCDHKNIKQRSRNFSSLMWNWAIPGCGVWLMHFINNKLKMCKYHRNKNRSCSMRFHQSDDLLLSHFLQQTNWVLIFKRNSRNFSSSLSLSRIYSFEYSIRVRCSYWLGCLNMMHTCLCTQFTYQQAYHKQF